MNDDCQPPFSKPKRFPLTPQMQEFLEGFRRDQETIGKDKPVVKKQENVRNK